METISQPLTHPVVFLPEGSGHVKRHTHMKTRSASTGHTSFRNTKADLPDGAFEYVVYQIVHKCIILMLAAFILLAVCTALKLPL